MTRGSVIWLSSLRPALKLSEFVYEQHVQVSSIGSEDFARRRSFAHFRSLM
jgi:hypothetical protein